jgi:hypothetical protein
MKIIVEFKSRVTGIDALFLQPILRKSGLFRLIAALPIQAGALLGGHAASRKAVRFS